MVGAAIVRILDDIGQREREHVFHYNLGRLTKRDRKSKRSVEIWFDIDETAAWIMAIVRDQNGQVIRSEEISRSLPSPLEFFFPLKSAIIIDGVYIVRNKKQQTLAEVRL